MASGHNLLDDLTLQDWTDSNRIRYTIPSVLATKNGPSTGIFRHHGVSRDNPRCELDDVSTTRFRVVSMDGGREGARPRPNCQPLPLNCQLISKAGAISLTRPG